MLMIAYFNINRLYACYMHKIDLNGFIQYLIYIYNHIFFSLA